MLSYIRRNPTFRPLRARVPELPQHREEVGQAEDTHGPIFVHASLCIGRGLSPKLGLVEHIEKLYFKYEDGVRRNAVRACITVR